MAKRKSMKTPPASRVDDYRHPEAESLMRPEAGTQPQFRKHKPPTRYRYDSSLSPALAWDGQNVSRELGEWLLKAIEDAARLDAPHVFTEPRKFESGDGRVVESVGGLQDAVARLKALGRPFLDWTGKAERVSFDVPTLPLFIHERLSTKVIIETIKSHKRDQQMDLAGLYGDPQHSITDQVLRAYEYNDKWVNRMLLGDNLVVMNSLLHYEGMGGQVQMIYMDPPYGVKFGSNFQPFVRKREVSHNDDGDMTREPEMVKAYRDTWELGLHSYLTYLRDRLLLARDLLTTTGSIFVQISDENLHHVRELMDEVFGADNLISVITVVKTSGQEDTLLPSVCDYLLCYARDKAQVKYRQVWLPKSADDAGVAEYSRVELPDGSRRPMTREERDDWALLPAKARAYRQSDIVSQRPPGNFPVEFEGNVYRPITGYWKTGELGMSRLVEARRIEKRGKMLSYVRYYSDFPVRPITNFWPDTRLSSRSETKAYVVQTPARMIERCILMTTDAGDLVFDPTCGSGTMAYVAEQWGRRWITADVSRVPLALARQRLLTATFPWYALKEENRGPAGGFVYKRRQNARGEEVGGIVPHVTLKSIANNEPPTEEVLVDRPEVAKNIVRVTGPFTVEASIPMPADGDGDGRAAEVVANGDGSFTDRMLEVLRKSPVLRLDGNRTIKLRNVRPPAKTLSLSAEATVEGHAPGTQITPQQAAQVAVEQAGGDLPFTGELVAFVFGPENGVVSEKLVFEAAREAHAKGYTHLYVIGFAIQPNARKLVDECDRTAGIPATYAQATPDLMMGDLLKTMRSSQIFSVCGLPEIAVRRGPSVKGTPATYQVELLGLDVFDPVTMEVDHRAGDDVPAWFLDTNYNGQCFLVSQAFFPRTAAWEGIKGAVKGQYREGVWDHLAGTTSAPFEAGHHAQVAVKVIDDRGNELLVVKPLSERPR